MTRNDTSFSEYILTIADDDVPDGLYDRRSVITTSDVLCIKRERTHGVFSSTIERVIEIQICPEGVFSRFSKVRNCIFEIHFNI